MVPILAKQAVMIKCQAGNGIIISNYECAYGAGLLCRIAGIAAPDWDQESLGELLEKVLRILGDYRAEDVRAQILLEMLKKYKPDGTSDEQVRQLYRMGAQEDRPWEK